MVTLETERLILRPFCAGDFAAVHAYGSVPENVKYMLWGPNREEDTRAFLRECEADWRADPIRDYEFAVTCKPDGRVIGGCNIMRGNSSHEAMLGWILHRDYWRQGITPEAARAMLAYCFGTLGLHRVYATCHAENYGSYRVMEKIGMRREAHFHKSRFKRVGGKEVWFDELHYAILKDEWAAQTGPAHQSAARP